MPDRSPIVRVGPVHFQPLEWELAPIMQYLRGNLLNAGCGSRDLGAFFRKAGIEHLVNYDIASPLDGAILGSLDAMPFSDGQFDSILCNAVLEHVASAEAVTAELARVLRVGGFLILAVPFLQPFHACPLDFRRFTKDGLISLGESAGLKAVAAHPVHSAAQTLGWIAWAIAREKKNYLLQLALWPWIFLATRIWLRTDPGILHNANTYQVVFTRP